MDQDILSEGIISLEKARTHNKPSNVLTQFVQAAFLGQHFPNKTQSFERPLCLAFLTILQLNAVKHVKEDLSSRAHAILVEGERSQIQRTQLQIPSSKIEIICSLRD